MTLISLMDHLGGIAHAFCTFLMLEGQINISHMGKPTCHDPNIRTTSLSKLLTRITHGVTLLDRHLGYVN